MVYTQSPDDWANPVDNFDNWQDDDRIYVNPVDDDDDDDKPDDYQDDSED